MFEDDMSTVLPSRHKLQSSNNRDSFLQWSRRRTEGGTTTVPGVLQCSSGTSSTVSTLSTVAPTYTCT